LVSFTTTNFSGASMATNTRSSVDRPPSACSKAVYPKPCRVV